MFNVVLACFDYFQDIPYVVETKLDFVSFDIKKLQRRQKFVSDCDFPLQNSYAGQVQCLSNSRAQKFVTSLVQSAIRHRLISFLSHL